jgi:hypothetical protein
MIRRRYTAALWIGGNLVFGARDLGMLSARSQPRHHRLRLPDRHRATVALRRLCFVSILLDHCRRLPRLLLHGGRQHRERYCAGRPPRQVARHYGLDAAPTIDVTAARRADEELHRAQAELAHVIRLPTLGELLAL